MASTIHPTVIENESSKNDSAAEDSSEDDSDMPPLEQIEKEMSGPVPKKNIVIPGENDKKHSDDEDVDAAGYIDILNNKDLRKKVLKPGNGQRPTRGSKVAIRLVTRLYNPKEGEEDLEDSTELGSGRIIEEESFDRLIVNIGDNDLHQGLDLVLPLMEAKETARAIIKARFAYGPVGNRAVGIPESASLDMEVELLEILDTPDELANFGGDESAAGLADKESLEERERAGTYKKDRGNFWFQRTDFTTAIQCYRGAIKYLDLSEAELKELDEARKEGKEDARIESLDNMLDKRAQTFNNLAAAHIKLLAFDMAARSIEQSLLLRPNNVKALFRRAKINQECGKTEEAIEDLKRALEINPDSEAVAQELEKMNRILKRQVYEQRELYRRMMQTHPKDKCKNNFGDDDEKEPCEVASIGTKLKHWGGRFGLPAAGVLLGALGLQVLYSSLVK